MKVFQFAKSSYSTLEKDCVEVARNIPRTVAVRDSKRPGGPVLTVTPAAWDAFTADVRRQP
ncbi:DUF397 domain-containing protein [Streptomyces sp. NBC_00654]|uniref:DUF397 domain-containing protein n=1 Tax=Streptomyces sp. NBC_00654 TaxID=2975799 RepID=UPI00224F6AB3|nr:DUF397 domain-containing protein [Streptomyces sp. NBC_00654]MCX4963489.1 DUF397 domain-containing protein [Streptomyces sp. NBC_00654]